MKTKQSPAVVFIAIIALVLVAVPHVIATVVSIYRWLKPLVLNHLKAQAGTDVTVVAVEVLETVQTEVLKVDSTILMVVETVKQVNQTYHPFSDTLPRLELALKTVAFSLYLWYFPASLSPSWLESFPLRVPVIS